MHQEHYAGAGLEPRQAGAKAKLLV